MLSMFVVGVSVAIFSMIGGYVKSSIDAKKPEMAKYSTFLIGAIFLVVAWFLGRKFRAGILGDIMTGMGAAGVVAIVGGILEQMKKETNPAGSGA